MNSKDTVLIIDYANPSVINYTGSSDVNHKLAGVTPIDDKNLIVSGYDLATAPNKFIFYSSNQSNHFSLSTNWAIKANTFGK